MRVPGRLDWQIACERGGISTIVVIHKGENNMKTSFFMEKNNGAGSILADTALFSRECVLAVSGIYEKEYYISIDIIESHVKITMSGKDEASFLQPFESRKSLQSQKPLFQQMVIGDTL